MNLDMLRNRFPFVTVVLFPLEPHPQPSPLMASSASPAMGVVKEDDEYSDEPSQGEAV